MAFFTTAEINPEHFEMCAVCGNAKIVCNCGNFREFVLLDFEKCFIHKKQFVNGWCPICFPEKFMEIK